MGAVKVQIKRIYTGHLVYFLSFIKILKKFYFKGEEGRKREKEMEM